MYDISHYILKYIESNNLWPIVFIQKNKENQKINKKLLIWQVDRPIIHIGSIGTSPIDPFWNLESAPITHWPNFCGSGQLPNGSTRPISIHSRGGSMLAMYISPRPAITLVDKAGVSSSPVFDCCIDVAYCEHYLRVSVV